MTQQQTDTSPNMCDPVRNLNLGRVLALLAKQHPICGIDSEGNSETGTTRLWAEDSGHKRRRIYLELDNNRLNSARLSETESASLINLELARLRDRAWSQEGD